MKKYLTIIQILFLFSIASCNNREACRISPEVQARCESIKKEISRLSTGINDTLKLEALQFLMEHVPYRTHYKVPNMTIYSDTIKKYTSTPKLQEEKLRELARLYSHQNGKEVVNDAFHLTGEQLFEHVSKVTDFYQLTPWSDQIPLHVFQEYLLPYNIYSNGNNSWINYYREQFFQENDSAILDVPLVDAFKIVHNWIYKKTKGFRVRWGNKGLNLPDLSPQTYNFLRAGSCDDIGKFSLIIMRSLSIPTSIDFTPTYLNRPSGHSWNTAVISENKFIPYISNNGTPGKYQNANFKLAKVYRQSFSGQTKQQKHFSNPLKPLSSLPKFIFYSDVTDQYTETSDLVIPLKKRFFQDNNIGWLSVFTREGWTPVARAKATKNSLTFNKVGRGGVYYVLNAQGKNITKKNAPFLLKPNGEILYFIPDTSHRTTINLFRKYTFYDRNAKWLERMIGGRFEGANSPDFSDREILSEITERPSEHFNTLHIENNTHYRYVRYLSPPQSRGNVAEIKFFGSDSIQSSLKGDVIGTKNYNNVRELAFDDNPLTFVRIWKRENIWVGMKFNKPEVISKIKYMPRNDMNAIQPGDEYELFYWNEEWKSLGRKTADSTTLQYDNAPSNALFWLKNHSAGREERIFSYENGQQVWW
ncbi:hypothetical protein [Marinilabilia sp.]